MNMSFAEKSAWGLLVGLGLMSWWYFPRAFAVATQTDNPMALGAISVVCIIGRVVVEAVYHAVIAGSGGDQKDERDDHPPSLGWIGAEALRFVSRPVGHTVTPRAIRIR